MELNVQRRLNVQIELNVQMDLIVQNPSLSNLIDPPPFPPTEIKFSSSFRSRWIPEVLTQKSARAKMTDLKFLN